MRLLRLVLVWFGVLVAAGGSVRADKPASEARVAARGIRPGPAKRLEMVDLQKSVALAKKVNTPFRNPSPHSLQSGSFSLTVSTKSFPSGDAAAVSTQIPPTFHLLSYNEQSVGPTIRVTRGTTLKIRLKNALHGPEVKPDPGPNPSDGRGQNEAIHGLCTTNLHTHGLHVSPRDPADNIFREINPGAPAAEFSYDIRADHPAGTFWYHPHKHGSVAYQLSNGLAGALIVEGKPGDQYADLDDIKAISDAEEQILVLQWYTFSTYTADATTPAVGFIDALNIYNADPRHLRICPEIKPTGTVAPPDGSRNVLAINGTINPVFNIQKGEIQRWRFIHGGWDVLQTLAWFKEDKDGNDAQTSDIKLYEIALDGLPTGKLQEVLAVQIAPGQRSDILLQAPLTSGTYFLKRLATDQSLGAAPTDEIVIAKLVVGTTEKRMQLPDPAALVPCARIPPIVPGELVDPTIPDPSDSTKTLDTLTLLSNDSIDGLAPGDPAGSIYTINGRTFHQQKTIPLTLQTAQQWTIAADPKSNSGHPFHIHVNPFQVISYTDPTGFTLALNQWRDTLFIPPGASYVIRSRFQDYVGESVLHCHILDHEDQGMMVKVNFLPAGAGNGKQTAVPHKVLNRVESPAPPLRLADTMGKAFDLASSRGRNVVLVLFQGVDCFHCASQLRDLVRDGRDRP